MDAQQILELEMESYSLGKISIREFLKRLLERLWEGDTFSPKRPFGNSGWRDDVYAALIKNGLIEGAFDEYGYLAAVDDEAGRELVFELIASL